MWHWSFIAYVEYVVIRQLGLAGVMVSDVILCARWRLYYGPISYTGESVQQDAEEVANSSEFACGFLHTVQTISALGNRVWIIDQAPEPGYHVPSVLSRSSMFHRPLPPARIKSDSQSLVDESSIDATFAYAHKAHGIHFVAISEFLWNDQQLMVTSSNGRPLYRDTNHLQNAGAEVVRPALDEMMWEISFKSRSL